MNAEEFAIVFDEHVRQPLEAMGCKSSGKSLYFVENYGCLSLIRLGGRMAAPGGASHILCFRHTFLRTRSEVVPRGFVSDVFDYPYKLLLGDFEASAHTPYYRPRHLNYDYDRLKFDGVSQTKLRESLKGLSRTLAERAIPWARTLHPRRAFEEVRQHGEDAWIERIWLKDYARHLAQAPKQPNQTVQRIPP